MDFDEIKQQAQEKWEDFARKMNEWQDQAKEYFSQLNQNEIYGWVGEGVGFVIFIVGIILLML
ncbi:hypothetical protein GOV11_01525 [Candidatus Woesearchaeota archaeon]|nr:hypothetical protein [Candidatus Woesearchaeota archaeon]